MGLKTTMVAVTRSVTVKSTVYVEVVANNKADAIARARETEISNADFIREAITELKSGDDLKLGSVTTSVVGDGADFHSPSECKLCAALCEDEPSKATLRTLLDNKVESGQLKSGTDLYFAMVAWESYGAAIRDNNFSELVALGRAYEAGDDGE